MFIERVVSIDKTYQEWTGFVHELHNEPSEDRLKVITSYVDWIRMRCK
jgi:alpha-beta hydrolase superfamily lysophospholipase